MTHRISMARALRPGTHEGTQSASPDRGAGDLTASARVASTPIPATAPSPAHPDLYEGNVARASRVEPARSPERVAGAATATAMSILDVRVQAVRGRSAGGDAPETPLQTLAPRDPSRERDGPDFPPLASAAAYADLVARQAERGSVSLEGLARPGIATYDAEKATWVVLQGAGRLEKARPSDWLDLFVEAGTAVPEDARIAARGVAAECVRDANLLSSRGRDGANPELVGLLTQGRVFDRVFVLRRDAEAPTSGILYQNRKGYRQLVERMGSTESADRLLAQHDYAARSAVEQRLVLQHLGVIAPEDD